MNGIELLDCTVASAFYGHFSTLRPAQEATIEPLINGKNLVLSSGTGSGKTEAALAPLISRYWRQAVINEALTIVYIAPTKALVNDLEKRLYLPLSRLGLRIGIRHGDRDDLVSGQTPHILVTTPESLDVLIFHKDIALKNVQVVIIDEVHLLYNTQRGLHLSILLHRLQQILGRDIQWVALSATVGRLQDIQTFLFGEKENTVFLEFPGHRSIDAHIKHITDEISFLNLIIRLTQGSHTKLLIFANSRRECERLASILYQNDYFQSLIVTHYSSLSSEVRLESEHKFSQLKTAICIATSTLELGIDIGDIDAVILWGCPGSVESFLQRIGRSNRRQNKTNVICLIPDTSEDVVINTLKFLALIDAAQKGELPLRSPYELFGAIGQQVLSVIASNNGSFTRVADLFKLVEHKYYFKRSILEDICSELESNNYLQKHGFRNQYGANEKLYKLIDYRLIYGNFGYSSRTVEIRYQSKVLGEVPIDNLLRFKKGDLVRFSAQIWQIHKVSLESILLEPAQAHRNKNVIDFIYSSSGISGDSFVCDRIWQILYKKELSFDILSSNLQKVVEKTVDHLSIYTSKQIPYTRSSKGIRYFTFAGYLVNKAIALITKQESYQVDDISLLVNSRISWESIPSNPESYTSIFNLLFEVFSNQSIYQALLPAKLQLYEFMQDWLKDETVVNILTRLNHSTEIELQIIPEELLI